MYSGAIPLGIAGVLWIFHAPHKFLPSVRPVLKSIGLTPGCNQSWDFDWEAGSLWKDFLPVRLSNELTQKI